jgi:CheY-like chemotaxis protein
MKILVVDDDSVCRMMARRILQGVPGYLVTEATDGAAAWDILRQGVPPDLCILDLQLPRMNGLELLAKIRSEPRLAEMSIGICTARGERSVMEMASKLQVRFFMVKPIQGQTLLDQVARIKEDRSHKKLVDDPSIACARLKLPVPAYRDILIRYVWSELNRSLGAVEQAVSSADWTPAFLHVCMIRSACDVLGIRAFADLLPNLEACLGARLSGTGSAPSLLGGLPRSDEAHMLVKAMRAHYEQLANLLSEAKAIDHPVII